MTTTNEHNEEQRKPERTNDLPQTINGSVISKDMLWVRLTCLFLLCFQNCTAILAIKYNSRVFATDGLKSLSTVVISLVNFKDFKRRERYVTFLLSGRICQSYRLYLVLILDKKWN